MNSSTTTNNKNDNKSLVDRVSAGDMRAVARAISKVEDVSRDAAELMKQIFPLTGRGWYGLRRAGGRKVVAGG